MSTHSEKKGWDLKWMKIADVLSRGFWAVYRGKKVPIDVIEEVQKLYFEAISQELAKARQEEREKTIKELNRLINDHYWDSLTNDKYLIKKHFEGILSQLNK